MVSLSGTLVAHNIKTSHISVPSLVKKDIAALFVAGKAMLVDRLEKNTVIGFAKQATYG